MGEKVKICRRGLEGKDWTVVEVGFIIFGSCIDLVIL
jgi:hypothetical protein